MALEYWQQAVFGASESFSLVEVVFPNDWDASSDVFYIDSFWIDVVTPGESRVIMFSSDNSMGSVIGENVYYSVELFSGLTTLPNPMAVTEGHLGIGISKGDSVRVTLIGNRTSSKTNVDLALSANGVAIYKFAPSV